MNSEEKKKSYLDFIIPLVFSLLILVADKYHFLSPVKKVTDFFVIPMKKAVYPIRKKEEDLMGTLGFYQKLDDYKIITEKLKKYEIILAEKRSLTAENEALRKQLEAPLPPELRLIPSRVLGVRRFMHIDKGEDDGVKKGLYVVSEKAYVGKIIDITPHTAQIELPFDPDTKIAAKTSRSTHGLVGGEFGNQTVLTNVLQKDELFLDDQVMTSGEDGILPELLIGKVSKIEGKDYEVYKKGYISPLINYHSLDMVFVVEEI